MYFLSLLLFTFLVLHVNNNTEDSVRWILIIINGAWYGTGSFNERLRGGGGVEVSVR